MAPGLVEFISSPGKGEDPGFNVRKFFLRWITGNSIAIPQFVHHWEEFRQNPWVKNVLKGEDLDQGAVSNAALSLLRLTDQLPDEIKNNPRVRLLRSAVTVANSTSSLGSILSNVLRSKLGPDSDDVLSCIGGICNKVGEVGNSILKDATPTIAESLKSLTMNLELMYVWLEMRSQKSVNYDQAAHFLSQAFHSKNSSHFFFRSEYPREEFFSSIQDLLIFQNLGLPLVRSSILNPLGQPIKLHIVGADIAGQNNSLVEKIKSIRQSIQEEPGLHHVVVVEGFQSTRQTLLNLVNFLNAAGDINFNLFASVDFNGENNDAVEKGLRSANSAFYHLQKSAVHGSFQIVNANGLVDQPPADVDFGP